ncbi:MAG: exosortase system-associated protein, TIGR04073 family [Candidatus Omnitrophica bacterium]|nr:exosortase system-associated protein, TIGR04073 family [Candidatus Omnitrophota bacterium]
MAKRFVLIGVIILLVASFAMPAYCDDSLKKLGRGVCNIGTCPVELFLQTSRVNNSDGPMAAFTYGVMKGVAMMCVRAVVGVYEVATFPIPVPKNYEPILKDPEFMFEDQNW